MGDFLHKLKYDLVLRLIIYVFIEKKNANRTEHPPRLCHTYPMSLTCFGLNADAGLRLGEQGLAPQHFCVLGYEYVL